MNACLTRSGTQILTVEGITNEIKSTFDFVTWAKSSTQARVVVVNTSLEAKVIPSIRETDEKEKSN